jgi:hypothetical protein
MKYLLMNAAGRFFASGDAECWKEKKSEATSYSERSFAEHEIANRFSREVRPHIRIIEVPDWTLKPLGTARPLLRARAAVLVMALCDDDTPANMVDAVCDDLEETIAAFRDNER